VLVLLLKLLLHPVAGMLVRVSVLARMSVGVLVLLLYRLSSSPQLLGMHMRG
jgi:hypothetical protein